jgi:SAM-dependent methyltransferase
MEEEYRFSAAMNWLRELSEKTTEPEELEAVLFALRHSADNAEGIELPGWLLPIFASLPLVADGVAVPNYIESFLGLSEFRGKPTPAAEQVLNTFCRAWNGLLADEPWPEPERRISVVEPACGSANDYRFLHDYGIARLIDYTGFDLCAKNIANARSLFPAVRFELGNVFELPGPDKGFDCCVVQDLFEHLSLEGLEAAVQEVCRITRDAICVGFFQMDEIKDHVVRAVDEYHWNLLSMDRMRKAFGTCGFSAQVLHVDTFLRQKTGCDKTHNPNAYSFCLSPIGESLASLEDSGGRLDS